ncbi:MAG TPA: hypothetical protein ENL16_01240, partial [Candidatus Woesearchaeota archaeon]|nr:hypothetical protein [Candidatus Woesearchaeota archaeon]
MFEWLEELFKMGPTWQARGERRKARRLKTLLFKREPKLNKKLKKALLSGNIKRVVKAFHAEKKLDEKEAGYAFLVLKKMRVIIYKQLDILRKINRAIDEDKNLSPEEKKVLVNKINYDIRLIDGVIRALLRGEDNFAHGDRTLSVREALSEGSILNDFYFCGRNEIRKVRRSVRDEKRLLSALQKSVKNEKVQSIIKRLENDLKAETKNELREAVDAMVILYDIEKKIYKEKATIKELVIKEGFP